MATDQRQIDPQEVFKEVPFLSSTSPIVGVDINYHEGGVVLTNLNELRQAFGQIAMYSAPQDTKFNKFRKSTGKFIKRLLSQRLNDKISQIMASIDNSVNWSKINKPSNL